MLNKELTKEEYDKKSKEIFRMINEYRKNPKALAKQIEILKKYLDPFSKILSEPGKVQLQMNEGEFIFNETIDFLNKLTNLGPLVLDENLCKSAMDHVLDIGPKGELSYESSDGTEPEERIAKYGNYVDSVGENIDFGPNDSLGVIISMAMDDGEPDRPHRKNIFKANYKKVGIACGYHKSEFQMCVMDFAIDFLPLETENILHEETLPKIKINFNEQQNSLYKVANNPVPTPSDDKNTQSYKPVSKNDNTPKLQVDTKSSSLASNRALNPQPSQPKTNYGNNNNDDYFGDLANRNIDVEDLQTQIKTFQYMDNKKLVSKHIEVTTRVVYFYEDGTSKEVSDKKSQTFLNSNK